MNKNKPLIFAGIVLLSIILITSLIIIFQDKNIRNQQASALIVRRNAASGSDHLGSDCPVMTVSCTVSKSTVYSDEDVKFSAEVGIPSDHWQECTKSRLQYTWKDFSIGTKDGINLKVYVTSPGGTTKGAVCPNVKVLPKNNSGGVESHQCGLILVNGFGSTPPLFSTKVKDRVMDQGFTYTDRGIHGVGNKFRSVTARSLMPKNIVLTSNNVTNLISGIKSKHEEWSTINSKVLIPGFSLGGVAAFNYVKKYNITDATILLYDPPHGWYYRPIKPCLFNSSLYNNGSAICWAEWHSISNFITENWTNGTTNPDNNGANCVNAGPSHTQFLCQPSVLDEIPAWVEDNCPHLYFHNS
jgi:hypothetical protein